MPWPQDNEPLQPQLTPGMALWNFLKGAVPSQLNTAGNLAAGVAKPFTNLFGNGGQEFWQGPQNPQAATDMRNALMTMYSGTPTGKGASLAAGALPFEKMYPGTGNMVGFDESLTGGASKFAENYPYNNVEPSGAKSLHGPLPAPAALPPVGQGMPVTLRGYRGSAHQESWPPYGPGPRGFGTQNDTFWASTDPASAQTYTVRGSDEAKFHNQYAPNIMPAEANFKNPLVVDAYGNSWSDIPVDQDTLHHLPIPPGVDTTDTDALALMARSAGHDGLVVKNVLDSIGGNNLYPAATTIAALRPGTVTSPLTGETLFAGGQGNPLLAALMGLLGPQQQGQR